MKKVYIENTTNWALPERQKKVEKKIVELIFYLLGTKNFEFHLFLVSDREIQEYNLQRRGKNKATDVLSFPIAENLPVPHKILGEVIISTETLERQAREIGHSSKDEFYRLVVHGILHLLGYDHERSPKDEKIMQAKEDECLDFLEKFV